MGDDLKRYGETCVCVCVCVGFLFFKEAAMSMEKEMATHSSVLAWRIPWTEKSGRL